MRWNVRNRFMVAFVLVAVIPLVIFAALVYTAHGEGAARGGARSDRGAGRRCPRSLRQRITDERAFLRDYAVWDDFHTAMREGRRQWIRNNVTSWVPDSSLTDLVAMYDTTGHVVARGDGDV